MSQFNFNFKNFGPNDNFFRQISFNNPSPLNSKRSVSNNSQKLSSRKSSRKLKENQGTENINSLNSSRASSSRKRFYCEYEKDFPNSFALKPNFYIDQLFNKKVRQTITLQQKINQNRLKPRQIHKDKQKPEIPTLKDSAEFNSALSIKRLLNISHNNEQLKLKSLITRRTSLESRTDLEKTYDESIIKVRQCTTHRVLRPRSVPRKIMSRSQAISECQTDDSDDDIINEIPKEIPIMEHESCEEESPVRHLKCV
ncbi:unnamed protein product [Blepharisma stoltei]|uniref:Uncharacterized protein n=1 Tax=Blepharisma stoltei TaxID=1481888 RepID=A0AAU9JMK9_9CILI|nr:unnamed protein product [Blepharisma stoltei]